MEHDLHVQSNNHQTELDSQKKLTSLYKRNYEDSIQSVNTLESRLHGLEEVKKDLETTLSTQIQQESIRLKTHYINIQEALESKIVQLQTELSSAAPRSSNLLTDTTSALPNELQGISTFTDMFDRVVQAEKESNVLRVRNKELESYLTRMVKDIEKKAPQIASLKADYHRVLESNEVLSSRYDMLIHENATIRQEVVKLESDNQQLVDENNLLKQSKIDLSQQLQHLLRLDLERSAVGIAGAGNAGYRHIIENDSQDMDADAANMGGDVISRNLVMYDNIVELQNQNEQLLLMVRKLTNTANNNNANGTKSSVSSTIPLTQLQEQLNYLKEQRQEQVELIAQLIQQRDMYKSMVEEGQIQLGVGENNNMISNNSALNTPIIRRTLGNSASDGNGNSPVKLVTNDNTENQELKHQIQELTNRVNRYIELERILNEAIDTHKSELYALKLDHGKCSSDMRYQQERYERLDALSHSNTALIEELTRKRMELENTVIQAQKEHRHIENQLNQNQESVHKLEELLKRKEVECEVLKGSEQRLMTNVTDLREELKRQVGLLESVHRMELSLSSRVEEDKLQLKAECEHLKAAQSAARKEYSENLLLSEHKILKLEDELKQYRVNLESKDTAHHSSREELIRITTEYQLIKDRCAYLEKQLELSNERLIQVSSNSGSNSGFHTVTQPSDTSQGGNIPSRIDHSHDILLERTLNEVELLKSQLSMADTHMQELKQISQGAESLNVQLRHQLQVMNADHQLELSSLREQLNAYNKQQQSIRTALLESEQLKDEMQRVLLLIQN